MPLETPHNRPSAEQAARRLLILRQVVIYAQMTPPRDFLQECLQNWSQDEQTKFARDAEVLRDQVWGRICASSLGNDMSPWEREYANATSLTMTYQQGADGLWRIEAAQVIMWALRLIEELPPYDTQADEDLLKQIHPESVSSFIKSAVLRPSHEIDKARDMAEHWHWRSRTQQLIESGFEFDPDIEEFKAFGFKSLDDIVRHSVNHLEQDRLEHPTVDEDFAVNGKPYRDLQPEEWEVVRSITVERHFALNWLCGYAPGNRWDETPTET